MGAVTKRELARILADRLGCTATLGRQLVDALFAGLKDAILGGGHVEIRGFGSFTVKRTKPRPQARNPKTGERVFVPARRRVSFRPGKAMWEALSQPQGAARILVVDDEEEVRRFLCRTLRMAGYEVDEASDGEEGVQRVCEQPVDVAVVDIMMPRKTGLEVIRELRRDHPDVKIIAISGVGIREEIDMVSLALQYGAHRSLEKPLDVWKFLEAVKGVLAGR